MPPRFAYVRFSTTAADRSGVVGAAGVGPLLDRLEAGELLVLRRLHPATGEGKRTGRPPSLTADQQAEVRRRLAAGASVGALAREFLTTRQTIMRIRDAPPARLAAASRRAVASRGRHRCTAVGGGGRPRTPVLPIPLPIFLPIPPGRGNGPSRPTKAPPVAAAPPTGGESRHAARRPSRPPSRPGTEYFPSRAGRDRRTAKSAEIIFPSNS